MRYKIAIDDVITYLRSREQLCSMIPVGAVSARKAHIVKRPQILFRLHYPGTEDKVAEYFAFVYEEYPDVLTVKEIAETTGINTSTITKWI